MIGRLLQSAASTFSPHSSPRSQPPLESVTEEAHTRDLLYPEVSSLRQGQPSGSSVHNGRTPYNAREAASYDDVGGLNVSYPVDIRIVIAQDANPRHQQPQVLFDSAPPPTSPTIRQEAPPKSAGDGRPRQEWGSNKGPGPSASTRGSPKHQHTRQTSMFQIPHLYGASPVSPRSPELRSRRTFGDSTPRSSTFEASPGESETTQGRIIREGKEDTEALLSCMFGAPGFRLEPGTKLHVIPRKITDQSNSSVLSPVYYRPGSSGGLSRQRTPLMRSTSTADLCDMNPMSDRSVSSNSKSSLVITRLFSVHLSDTESPESDETLENGSPIHNGESLDSPSRETTVKGTSGPTKDVKQTKTPMFAIALILQLPNDTQRVGLRKSASQMEASSLGSSYEYTSQSPDASWRTGNNTLSNLMDVQASSFFLALPNNHNVHIAKVLAQWNIIGKCLISLETTIRSRLLDLLTYQKSLLIHLITAPRPPTITGKPKKVKLQSQQSVYVDPGCLQKCVLVQNEVSKISQRVIGGLRTRRVVTGQGRWGAWREEARWVGRWAGGRDQNFFFFNVLTAFLGSHTAWMDSFEPALRKRRHVIHNHPSRQEAEPIRQRTIIVSNDKMAARRLIFLLAAFLPGTHNKPRLEAPQSPQLMQATMVYSQSPASLPTVQDFSQRRTLDERATNPRKTNGSGHGRSVSFSVEGLDENSNVTLANHGHERRTSDARSIRGASLAIPTANSNLRKSSTSTLVAESTVPVPHFADLGSKNLANSQRPGSSGSLASLALNQSLRRSDSVGLSNISGSAGRFGSMVSGFWSIRRGSSTDDGNALASSQESPADSRLPKDLTKLPAPGRLARMVEEVSPTLAKGDEGQVADEQNSGNPVSLEQMFKQKQITFPDETADRKLNHASSKGWRAPLKLAVNEEDGTIDIELPRCHSFASSLGSSFGSSQIQRTAPNSFHEHHSPYGMPDSPRMPSDPVIDVAGWLKRYHQDFSLQAVRPYEALEEDVKESMLYEARLALPKVVETSSELPSDRWTDISTTLIADTTNFSIRRLRLRRRQKNPTSGDQSSVESPPQAEPASFEESLISEPLMDMDPTLIDAVERVLAQSGHSSCVHSRAPSPARSERGAATGLGTEGPALEVPHGECRRMVLGALEQVVRSVSEEQEKERGRGERMRGGVDSTLREGVRKWLAGGEDA